MKRSWFSIIIFAGLIGLLVVLAVVQYRWQSVASEAEREKMQVRADADVHRFADEFNREIQSAFLSFQFDPAEWNGRSDAAFTEHVKAWNENSEDPELLSAFYFFPAKAEETAYKYDPAAAKFEPFEADANISNLRVSVDKENNERNYFDEFSAIAIPINERPTQGRFVIQVETKSDSMPTFRSRPKKIGSIVLMLDKDVIFQKIIPRLKSKYFGNGEFYVSVNDLSGKNLNDDGKEITMPDATASLMDLLPGNFTFFSKTVKGEPIEAKKGTIVMAQRFETRSFRRTTAATQNDDGETSIKIGTAENSVGDNSAWKLNIQHSAGSIDAFIRGERNKNLAIGFGIYLLLIAGLSAIVLSAMRAKSLAQRQLDFVSSVSHEFRTPLAVIYSAGENLADGIAEESDQVERYGDLIKGEGKKLSAMVEQILQFAGARSGKQKYDLRPANVVDIIDQAISECRPLIDEKAFIVEKEISVKLPAVLADPKALGSAIQNLILNSIKYSNGERWLKVSATNGGGNVKISVEDRGIGISRKDRSHIFEPFYRAKDVVDEQIHGNGLGLSLVKQIVEAHHGTVKVESEIGKGSRFIVDLPVHK